MNHGVKQGIAGAIFCIVLVALGLMIGSGVAVGDTQEAVGGALRAAGLLGFFVALIVIAVSLLRGNRG